MHVIKRDGGREPVRFDKITERLRTLAARSPVLLGADVSRVAQQVCAGVRDGIETTALDALAADVAVGLATEHPDYSALAARVLISNLHKNTSEDVLEVVRGLRGVVSREYAEAVERHAAELQTWLRFDLDYDFDYFGFKTLEKSYLLKGERPQHMYLRVALGIWGAPEDPAASARARATYEGLATHKFTHASPTLFNAGTTSQQLASCFLMGTHEDSLDGIFQAFHKAATISKYGGGLGMHVHAVRAKGSPIRSTNGTSDGLVPMLKVANEVVRYVNQCWLPETVVYTYNGPRHIASLEAGTHVLSRDGTFRRVNEVFCREVRNQKMVTLRTVTDAVGVTCTPVHEIFCLRRAAGDGAGAFCPASEIEVGDYMAFPIPITTCPDSLTEGEWHTYGMVVVGNHFSSVDPRCLHLDVPKVLAVLRGVLGLPGGAMRTELLGPESLLESVRYLCLRLGVVATRATMHSVHVPTTNPERNDDVFERDGMLYVRVTSTTPGVYSGPVYDLNVADLESYVTSGGLVHNSGKRKGSCAVYIEPHHADIMAVLDLKRNQGDEHLRARDLFYAMWISDLFMRRVEAGATWSLFDPGTAPGLEDVHGPAYEELYERYEREGRAVRTLPAQDVWFAMLRSQIETGVPYVLFKDAANAKSNQQHLGTIKSSNLCVAPETLVLTRQRGHVRIADLRDDRVEVWNGQEWSWVIVRRTSPCAELLRVRFSNGTYMECTPHHIFYIKVGDDVVAREACDLQPGDALIDWDAPVIDAFGDDEEDHDPVPPRQLVDDAYHSGFEAGMAFSSPGRCRIAAIRVAFVAFVGIFVVSFVGLAAAAIVAFVGLAAAMWKLATHGNMDDNGVSCDGVCDDGVCDDVPMRAPMQIRLAYVAGVVDASDVTTKRNPFRKLVAAGEPEPWKRDFAARLQLLLLTMGVRATVCDDAIVIPPDGLLMLWHMGFAPRVARPWGSGVDGGNEGVRRKQPVLVLDVERTGREDETYCFTEPKRHMGVFNGVLCGQCTEIMEYTAPDEIAVCTLASLSLPAFTDGTTYDFEGLADATKVLTRALDKVIDVTFYPVPEARTSNQRHRPIGLGVQGLADVFFKHRLPFDSPGAMELNRQIFATVYHAALQASVELATELGPHPSFPGSPASQGKLQFDLWGAQPHAMYDDWDDLREAVRSKGLRNSLLVAPMPTATTAQILGNCECFEPITSNLYSRTTMAGTFTVFNKWLLRDLVARGLWTPQMKNALIEADGSVQTAPIPDDLKLLYRTAYELSMKSVIDMAADRGVYIDQSASMNLFVAEPTFRKLSSMLFHAWRKGLKTGMYYLRTKAASGAFKVTVPASHAPSPPAPASCRLGPECEACSG
jgi:ribonucleoside-diphosphate reductase alpha chain